MTVKQHQTMARLADLNVKVCGWSQQHDGPKIRFPTGVVKVLTKDGGFIPTRNSDHAQAA